MEIQDIKEKINDAMNLISIARKQIENIDYEKLRDSKKLLSISYNMLLMEWVYWNNVSNSK